MSKIVVLGAGMNGLIAAHYLASAGHKVTVIEKRGGSLNNWMGWKVLLDKDVTRKLMSDLGIQFKIKQAHIGIRQRAQQVQPLAKLSDWHREEAQRWYAIRTRRSYDVEPSERMPVSRSFLSFDTSEFLKSFAHFDIVHGAVLSDIRNDSVVYNQSFLPGLHGEKYDWLISTIPLWNLAHFKNWKEWPILTAVDMLVSMLLKEHMPDENRQDLESYDYIYFPFGAHITRAANHGDQWHIESVDDYYSPISRMGEIETHFGTHLYSDHRIPGQPFPQKLEPVPEIPSNWFLMGRHAAWNYKETVDVSLERLWTWMKQSDLV